MTVRYDVVVVGGGPAGCASAWHLASGGARVALIEKQDRAHHKVCGEFLSAECLSSLDEMGLDLSIAPVISHFRLHGPARCGTAALPEPGRGISRRALDEAMLRAAHRAGAHVLRGEDVRGLRRDGDWLVETESDMLRAGKVVCATGKHEFLPVQRRAGRDSAMVGFKLHLGLQAQTLRELDDHVDLFVFEGGYGGLSLVEDRVANLCFLMDRGKVNALPDWRTLSSRLAEKSDGLARYLADAEPLFWPPVTVAAVPYGFVRESAVAEDLYCIGDQLAVIPSLTGAGMAIAIYSGYAAARHILAGESAGAYHRDAGALLEPQVQAGYHVHRLFKLPRMCDLAASAVDKWPGLIELVFRKTRVRADGTVSSRG